MDHHMFALWGVALVGVRLRPTPGLGWSHCGCSSFMLCVCLYRACFVCSSLHSCRLRAKLMFCQISVCLLDFSCPSCHADACRTRRPASLAPSGPMPPQVPNAMGMKVQPARWHGASYFSCLPASFFLRKVRQRSRVGCVVREAKDHPCDTVMSIAVGRPFCQLARRRSAGRRCESRGSGRATSFCTPRCVEDKRLKRASCIALWRLLKLSRGQHSRWSPHVSRGLLHPWQMCGQTGTKGEKFGR